MKKNIHPKYGPSKVHCACGADFELNSTAPEMQITICSQCHPFFTGKQKFVDTAGRIEKFQKRFASSTETGGNPYTKKKAEKPAKA